ncbi:MAG TPA: cytochrome b/b6 domain-containing protein [Caulobacteraceae bacterium]|nr:cytochrome b/b6 domain-containing protein [Caulobacteraceae bacterium]
MTASDATANRAAAAGRRYDVVSIWLHWIIAALVVVQLCLGWYMNEVLPEHSPAKPQVLTIHISVGLTILILVLIRIGVRLTHPAPPLPPELPLWERILARATHVLFYLLLLALPLTGWTLVSLGTRPIHFWGLPWPHLPGVHAVFGSPAPRPVRERLAHVQVYILIWIVLLNLALHVVGALWLQFGKSPVLWRMTWLKPPRAAA